MRHIVAVVFVVCLSVSASADEKPVSLHPTQLKVGQVGKFVLMSQEHFLVMTKRDDRTLVEAFVLEKDFDQKTGREFLTPVPKRRRPQFLVKGVPNADLVTGEKVELSQTFKVIGTVTLTTGKVVFVLEVQP